MCEFYNVSKSGYYDWRGRLADGATDCALIALISECQERNKYRYGYRRVMKWLRREKKLVVNKKKVLRITNDNGLLSVIRRRKIKRYRLNGDLHYDNILNRDFCAEAPNKKWVTDISYIIMPDGVLYLSAIRDLCGNFIVAHKTAPRQDYPLVRKTVLAAVEAEKPGSDLILHSDGGGQYRSYGHSAILSKNNIIPSMSKPASPGDNACAENFFSIFKSECIYLEKPKTVAEAEKLTDEFVQYYNYERIQGNGLTPYEQRKLAFGRAAMGNG